MEKHSKLKAVTAKCTNSNKITKGKSKIYAISTAMHLTVKSIGGYFYFQISNL